MAKRLNKSTGWKGCSWQLGRGVNIGRLKRFAIRTEQVTLGYYCCYLAEFLFREHIQYNTGRNMRTLLINSALIHK